MVGKSLTSKILIVTLLIILIGIGLVVGYFLRAQNHDLVQERQLGLEQQASILQESIKNNMLVGETTIARRLLQDLKNVNSIRDVILFRINGKEAFTDNETIESINEAMLAWAAEEQEKQEQQDSGDDYGYSSYEEPHLFELTEVKENYVLDQSDLLHTTVRTQQRQMRTLTYAQGRELIYYLPLLNEEECQTCHLPDFSLDPEVRGVIRVSTPLTDVDQKIRQNTFISLSLWVAIVALLTVAIILSLDRMILKPIKVIGHVTDEVGRGNLQVKVPEISEDEIGYLGQQVNNMIVGLNERLKLTKFVSQATLEEVVSTTDLKLGGNKYERTVLFSDIRGFTAFTEQHDPQEVIKILNVYMQRQAGIILKAGGDVDQFVGDEILGVFRSATMAEDAVRAALAIIPAINDLNLTHNLDIHVGIGIHTGLMIEGNIGAQADVERLQRTVIGDAVNTGSRICSVAKPAEILISQATHDLIQDIAIVDQARTVQVKGKRQPLTVYPVQGLREANG